ncbi:MAG: UDP-N-acetylmuramoyl-L-alanine--D-glutamate ligase [Acidobacteria bacterium]|nr:UDP-N-acetylmuramoyl-L-alanine--D-glutamate ligase [Acidobacteriota bacterium]
MSALPDPGRALVVGLAKSGRAAAVLLRDLGWQVVAVDSSAVDAADLQSAGIEVRAPSDDPVPADLVVRSPGVPREFPPLAAAYAAGTPVWSEIELASRATSNPIMGITGTNGKTTTTELLAHVLREGGLDAVACGNVGTPMASLVGEVSGNTWLVVECSSFQLEDVPTFRPHAAVLLNVTPDHMDRYPDFDAYRRAKLNLFAHQGEHDLAILPEGLDATGAAPTRRLAASGAPGPDAVSWAEGGLHVQGLGLVAPWSDIPLLGAHNRENVMATAAMAAHAGLGAEEIARGLATFPGVPHRLEVVGEADGVTFVNDSKATNPAAAIAALDAYPQRVRLIAGGSSKGTPFDDLARAAAGPVLRAYLIGETAPAIAAAMEGEHVEYALEPDLPTAVSRAAADAQPGDVVLLAPACASFDQFTGYEHRGEVFREAAREAGAR